MPQIKPFQIDLAELGQDSTLQSNIDHINIANVGTNSHTAIDTHITDIVTSGSRLSTGLFTGGEISFGTLSGSPLITSLISVSAGSGIIVDSYTDPENPTYEAVSWSAFTDITVTNVATAGRTFIAIDTSGSPTPNIIQQTTAFTRAEHRDYIILGTIGHANNVNVVAVRNDPHAAFDTPARLVDLAEAIGPFNINGNIYGPNGVNLNIDKSAGESYRSGNNFHVDKASPDITTDAGDPALEWNYSYQDGSSGYTLTGKTPTIIPNNYDDGDGGLATVGANTWSVQIIKHFPGGAGHRIEYGQTTYGSDVDAIAAIPDTNHQHNPAFADGITRGYLVVRGGAADLSDTADAIFIAAPKFVSQAGGSGVSNTLNDLTDVIITEVGSPLTIPDNSVLTYDTASSNWVNQTTQEANMSHTFHIDVTTGGSPLMVETILPSGSPGGWSAAYNSTGNFTITHNRNDAEVGFALSVLYNGTARVINPTSITANAITFQITDTLDAAVEGNIVGKLLF